MESSHMIIPEYHLPWEPTTFTFRAYIGGVRPSFLMVLGSKGTTYYIEICESTQCRFSPFSSRGIWVLKLPTVFPCGKTPQLQGMQKAEEAGVSLSDDAVQVGFLQGQIGAGSWST